MAKGQKRSSREIRKPKQAKVKTPLTSEGTFSGQIKLATNAAPGGKGKS